MSGLRKIAQMTSLLFGLTLLFSYIGWQLGYEGFIIVGDIQLPYLVEFGILFCLFLTNISLQAGFVLREYSWKVLYFSIPITLVEAGRAIWFPNFPSIITLGFLPMVVFIFVSIPRKTFKTTLWSVLLINAVMLLHQFILSQITQTALAHDVSIYALLRFNIDIILFKLVFYILGMRGGILNGCERMVLPGRTRIKRNCDEFRESESQSTSVVPVDKFEKWLMRSVIIGVQVAQWIFILLVCSLDNLFLDALIISTSFICHGMIITRRKHLKPIILCTLAATATFYIAAKFTISFYYSQFFPIVIGLLLVYTMYLIAYYFDEAVKKKALEDTERIKKLESQVAEAWDRLDELS